MVERQKEEEAARRAQDEKRRLEQEAAVAAAREHQEKQREEQERREEAQRQQEHEQNQVSLVPTQHACVPTTTAPAMKPPTAALVSDLPCGAGGWGGTVALLRAFSRRAALPSLAAFVLPWDSHFTGADIASFSFTAVRVLTRFLPPHRPLHTACGCCCCHSARAVSHVTCRPRSRRSGRRRGRRARKKDKGKTSTWTRSRRISPNWIK